VSPIGVGRPEDQQLPVQNDRPYVQDLIREELAGCRSEIDDVHVTQDFDDLLKLLDERQKLGEQRYGVPGLQSHNGRDLLRDALEETLDAALYARALADEEGDADTLECYETLLVEALWLQSKVRSRRAPAEQPIGR